MLTKSIYVFDFYAYVIKTYWNKKNDNESTKKYRERKNGLWLILFLSSGFSRVFEQISILVTKFGKRLTYNCHFVTVVSFAGFEIDMPSEIQSSLNRRNVLNIVHSQVDPNPPQLAKISCDINLRAEQKELFQTNFFLFRLIFHVLCLPD